MDRTLELEVRRRSLIAEGVVPSPAGLAYTPASTAATLIEYGRAMVALNMVDINVNEPFEHLAHAPIVEAVIGLTAPVTSDWAEQRVRDLLEPSMLGYRYLDSQKEFEQLVTIPKKEHPSSVLRDLGWKGVRFKSNDERQIVDFNRAGYSFSRLEPYENWSQLEREALRLWPLYKQVGQPDSITRVGVRFINRIVLPSSDPNLANYLEGTPSPPQDFALGIRGFFHHDVFDVPGHSYGINVIRTIQPPLPATAGPYVILDIDVFTPPNQQVNEAKLEHTLREMRWLKNKVFFGSVTQSALELFR